MSADHLTGWTLRRYFAEEDVGEPARAHLHRCAECQSRLAALREAQEVFERERPLPAFAARLQRRTRTWIGTRAVAAAAALLVLFSPTVWSSLRREPNRLKGGAEVELRIAGRLGGAQRVAATGAPERLTPGERVRIGYTPGPHGYVAALSIDQAGVVTPLYPERGAMLPVERLPGGAAYLPGSLEFTGSGEETVVVVMAEEPLPIERLVTAARESYRRSGGRLDSMPPLDVPGEQFRRHVLKP